MSRGCRSGRAYVSWFRYGPEGLGEEHKTDAARVRVPVVFREPKLTTRGSSRVVGSPMKRPDAKALLPDTRQRFVVFTLDEKSYALRLGVVECVVGAVEINPLPKAPTIALGIVNFRGQVLPVFNVRQRFRLPPRETRLSDQLVLAHTAKRSVLLLVDSVIGVIERSAEKLIPAERILPRMKYVEGVTKLNGGLVLIHDLDKFLSLEEEELLTRVLADFQEARNA